MMCGLFLAIEMIRYMLEFLDPVWIFLVIMIFSILMISVLSRLEKCLKDGKSFFEIRKS